MKLSIIDKDILLTLSKYGYTNQRALMEQSGYSIGSVNKSISELTEQKLLDSSMKLTKKAKIFIKDYSPKNAIILAAGYGMRMVPINTETPKGLLTVDGIPLIERTIEQLHEVGITDITMIVGFMMEAYDYLVDKYDIKMIYNNDYASKNNLHSLAMAAGRIHKTYIKLNEEGTKAAAVTYFDVKDGAAAIDDTEHIMITFNRPFIYLIKDQSSNEILFFGTVYEPIWKE